MYANSFVWIICKQVADIVPLCLNASMLFLKKEPLPYSHGTASQIGKLFVGVTLSCHPHSVFRGFCCPNTVLYGWWCFPWRIQRTQALALDFAAESFEPSLIWSQPFITFPDLPIFKEHRAVILQNVSLLGLFYGSSCKDQDHALLAGVSHSNAVPLSSVRRPRCWGPVLATGTWVTRLRRVCLFSALWSCCCPFVTNK